MTSFPVELDSALQEFCRRHGLYVTSKHKDGEVRSIAVVDDNLKSYQIWVERAQTVWRVVAWDKTAARVEFEVIGGRFLPALEQAYSAVEEWIVSSGNTRTIA